MSALTDLKAQVAAAACFTCLPVDIQQAIKTYLLAVIAGGSLDPKTLLFQARGFFAIPSGMLLAVQATLAAQAAGTTASALVAQNSCSVSCLTPVTGLTTQLLALAKKAGGSTDPKTLAKAAACFTCIPSGRQSSVQAFLLAVIAGVIPPPTEFPTIPGPIGPPPTIPKSILLTAIKAFAYPPPIVQMILGDAIFVIGTGGATCAPMTVGSFLLDTFETYTNGAALNGLNGGSTGWCAGGYVDRTAYLGLQALDTMQSYANGANLLALNGGTGWGGAYGADNVSVQLNAANEWPVNGTNTTIVATASFGFPAYTYQWNKNGAALTNAGHYSGVTTATLTITGYNATDNASYTCTVSDTTGRSTTSLACVTLVAATNAQFWAALVAQTNGGPWPSQNTVTAFDTWDAAVTAASIKTKLYHVNLIAPDSLAAALTPFISTVGASLWTKHIRGIPPTESITVNGLKAGTDDTNGIVYDTGFAPSGVVAWTASNGGISVYVDDGTPPVSADDLSGCWDGVNAAIGLQLTNAGTTHLFICWDVTQRVQYLTASVGGFYMASRSSVSLLTAYFANSGNAWASTGTNVANTGRTPNAQNIGVCGEIQAGPIYGPNPSRISFVAYHDGFSSADGQALFNAVQALRVSLGGGYV